MTFPPLSGPADDRDPRDPFGEDDRSSSENGAANPLGALPRREPGRHTPPVPGFSTSATAPTGGPRLPPPQLGRTAPRASAVDGEPTATPTGALPERAPSRALTAPDDLPWPGTSIGTGDIVSAGTGDPEPPGSVDLVPAGALPRLGYEHPTSVEFTDLDGGPNIGRPDDATRRRGVSGRRRRAQDSNHTEAAVGAAQRINARKARSASRSKVKWALEWVILIGGAVAIALLIKTFAFQAFSIPSESMFPLLKSGDRVVVNKLSYRLHDVNRGDIVVFDKPKDDPSLVASPEHLIKRVIGLPGETVEARDGVVYIDGKPLEEPYLADGLITDHIPTPIKVEQGRLLVMGDNRTNSHDGRFFGTIPESAVVGRAFIRLWPLNRIGSL